MATRIASAAAEIKIWDLTSRAAALHTFQPHTSDINCLRWHPNGSILASASDDGSIAVNHESGALIERLVADPGSASAAVKAICFSTGARYLCGGGAKQVVNVWDLKRRQVIQASFLACG